VAGGVHGNNRLGGNSLLDCVVFGRVTGRAATKYILGDDVKKVNLAELTCGGLSGEVKGSKIAGGSYEDNMNEAKEGGAPAPKQKNMSSGGGPPAVVATAAKVEPFTDERVCACLEEGYCCQLTQNRTAGDNLGLVMKFVLFSSFAISLYVVKNFVYVH